MKKLFLAALLTVLIFLLACGAAAVSGGEIDSYSDKVQSSLDGVISADTRRELERFGVDIGSFESVYNVSLSSIRDYFSENLAEKFNAAANTLVMLTAAVMLTGAALTVCEGMRLGDAVQAVCSCAVFLMCVERVNTALNAAISVLSLSCDFLKGYIPIFAAIVAFSSNPATALSFNTVVLAAAQAVSVFADNFAVTVIGAFISLACCLTVSNSHLGQRICSVFSRLSSLIIGFAATAFTGVLSVKGSLSAAVDSSSVKSVRFLISSLIPVVGSSISDAYASIIASVNLIKGSVAAIGILCVLILNIPAAAELLVYYLCFCLLSFLCGAVNAQQVGRLFEVFSCALKFLLLLLLFEVFILVISTGLILNFKGA